MLADRERRVETKTKRVVACGGSCGQRVGVVGAHAGRRGALVVAGQRRVLMLL